MPGAGSGSTGSPPLSATPAQTEVTSSAPGATDQLDFELSPRAQVVVRRLSWRVMLVLIGAALGTLVIVQTVRQLQTFLSILVISLFMSFAIEPGVNWFARHGWKRGLATGAIFVGILLGVIILTALLVPAIVSGVRGIIQSFPDWLEKVSKFAKDCCGVDVSQVRLLDAVQKVGANVAHYAANIAGNLLGIGASFFGAVFKWATIGLFTFYMVAEGPQFRRTVLRFFRPERQERILFVWTTAIEKTGAYFYSRLLLAIINGTGMYIVLRVLGVPFAAPLAVFCGVVAEFIPTVGTYIGGAPPVLVALLSQPTDALWVLAYILVYQQIENYFLAPKLTAKTMNLHPAVAFGSAFVGGALGGILAAFLALPAAAVIQAAIGAYVDRYQVIDSELTSDAPTPAPPRAPGRLRLWSRRRKASDGDPNANAPPPDPSGPDRPPDP